LYIFLRRPILDLKIPLMVMSSISVGMSLSIIGKVMTVLNKSGIRREEELKMPVIRRM